MDYSQVIMACVVLAMIVGDYATGIIKAIVANNLDSGKMRTGLFHKLAFVLALLLGWFCQWACGVFALPEAFSAIYPAVALWITLTEILSIFENLCEINPELTTSPLAGVLAEVDVNQDGTEDKEKEDE